MPKLTYDDASHTYRVDGIEFPSVTAVLGSVGIIETQFFSEDAAWRGSVVHKVLELEDLGTIDQFDVDPAAVPYLEAYRKAKAELNIVKIVEIEQPHYSPFGYAGRPDRKVLIKTAGSALQNCTIDLKTGQKAWWHRYQLAAYSAFYDNCYRRMTLRLDPPNYYLDEYPIVTRRADLDVFFAALKVHQAKGGK